MQLVRNNVTEVKASVTIESEAVSNLALYVRGSITRPWVVKQEIIDFGLNQAFTTQSKEFTIYNPSDKVVYFQFFITSGDLTTPAELKTLLESYRP